MVWPEPESGAARANIAADLAQEPGKALVIVRYSPDHQPLDEWVYNAADIDNSKVVWAREMDEAENLELMNYYKDRTVWLVQPDSKPAQVSLYPSLARQPLNANSMILLQSQGDMLNTLELISMRYLVQRNSDDNDDKRCQQQQKVFFDLHRQPSFNSCSWFCRRRREEL